MEKLPKKKLAPKKKLPFNPNKCTFCKFWKRKSNKRGICERMEVYFFAGDNKIEIRTPNYGLCNKFERREGVPDGTRKNSLHKHDVSQQSELLLAFCEYLIKAENRYTIPFYPQYVEDFLKSQ